MRPERPPPPTMGTHACGPRDIYSTMYMLGVGAEPAWGKEGHEWDRAWTGRFAYISAQSLEGQGQFPTEGMAGSVDLDCQSPPFRSLVANATAVSPCPRLAGGQK